MTDKDLDSDAMWHVNKCFTIYRDCIGDYWVIDRRDYNEAGPYDTKQQGLDYIDRIMS